MPDIQCWMDMYSSANRNVKLRAANGLLDRANEVPFDVLIDILVNVAHEGLGAKTLKALLDCRDPELVVRMISLLESSDNFVREVACNVLGRSGNTMATPHLLRMVDDPHVMVRRAAGLALACLKDSAALDDVRAFYQRHRKDDSNVVMALQCAMKSLEDAI